MPDAPPRQCHHCASRDSLRPYGPGGSFVCFPCATSPEHEEETRANYYVQLDAAAAVSPTGTVGIGTEEGPQPL